MTRRGAIYVRISRDPTGEQAGVQRQELLCRELAARQGIDVVAVYSDNDLSAYSGTPRPGYESLLEYIEAGGVDVVLVWHLDRLYRRPDTLEKYVDVCEPRGVPTISVEAGHLDLATPAGQLVARQLASVAHYESQQKARRQEAANAQRAQLGKHFGSRRPFGFELDGITPRQAEFDAIRDAVHAVIDGRSLASLARDWNERGFRTPQAGNEWDGAVLGRTLRTARLAGLRYYKGEQLYDEDGQPVMGEWPAVVDVDVWRTMLSVLNDAGRKWPAQSRGLLSGVARCGVCLAVMQSGGTRNSIRRYRCSGNGSHAYREAPPIDDFVSRAVVLYLGRPGIWQQLLPPRQDVDPTVIRAELADLQRRSDDLVELMADGTIGKQQLRSGLAKLAARQSALEAQLPSAPSPALALLQQAPDIEAVWDGMSDDERRGVIDSLLVVKILPTGGKEAAYLDWRRRIVNPDSLVLEWRGEIKRPADRARKHYSPS